MERNIENRRKAETKRAAVAAANDAKKVTTKKRVSFGENVKSK